MATWGSGGSRLRHVLCRHTGTHLVHGAGNTRKVRRNVATHALRGAHAAASGLHNAVHGALSTTRCTAP